MSVALKAETASSERESRAREWVRSLSGLPERFAGTAGERQAAEKVAGWMREIGARDVAIEPTPGAPRMGLVLAVHAGLGAIGCLWGGFAGAVLAILAAWSFRSGFRSQRPQLSKLLAAPAAVNVAGRFGAAEPRRRVILTAHIDTTQAGWLFSRGPSDLFASMASRMRRGDAPPPGALALPEVLIMLGALVALAAWLGAHGFLFGLLRGVAVFGLLLTCGLTLQWATAPATPGANDNASAVAAMLTCAEELSGTLPEDVELWVVGTGAEEVGCKGMRGFVDRHAEWSRESTYFVNFDSVGGGALHFIRSEGVLGKTIFPAMLLDLARRVAAAGDFADVTLADLPASTDGHVPAERGYPALSLIALESNGVPRNYHRREDTIEGIDPATVVRAADFGAAVAGAALRGEAGPITSAGA